MFGDTRNTRNYFYSRVIGKKSNFADPNLDYTLLSAPSPARCGVSRPCYLRSSDQCYPTRGCARTIEAGRRVGEVEPVEGKIQFLLD